MTTERTPRYRITFHKPGRGGDHTWECAAQNAADAIVMWRAKYLWDELCHPGNQPWISEVQLVGYTAVPEESTEALATTER